jgi:ribosomal protein L12E/L44/L45/RPP1/RPP2
MSRIPALAAPRSAAQRRNQRGGTRCRVMTCDSEEEEEEEEKEEEGPRVVGDG